jgi:hypothetical protein
MQQQYLAYHLILLLPFLRMPETLFEWPFAKLRLVNYEKEYF